MKMSFMGAPSKNQRAKTQDGRNPEANEHSLWLTPGKPEVDREQERCSGCQYKAKFAHLNLGHNGISRWGKEKAD
jgi:hypothetical protein